MEPHRPTTGILCICLLGAWLWYAEADDVSPEDVEHYGDPVQREFLLQQSADRSYIDEEVDLDWGFLYKYRAYVGNYTLDVRPIPNVRLQVWTQVNENGVNPEYKLKWEHILTADQGINRLYEIVVPESERIEVTSNDRLGLTGEAKSSPIALNYVADYKARYRNVKDANYPLVGDVYIFESLFLPTQFSIGISVLKSLPKEDDQVYCGVDIKPRTAYIARSGKTAWIDRNIELVAGVLEEVLFYVADISAEDVEADASVAFQIWSPLAGTADQFVLKWQHVVSIDQGFNRAYRISIPESSSVETAAADKLGWSFPGSTGYITHSFSPGYSVHKCLTCDLEENLAVGSNATFDRLDQPYQYSVGVHIKHGAKLGESSTGTTSMVTSHTATSTPRPDRSASGDSAAISQHTGHIWTLLLALASVSSS